MIVLDFFRETNPNITSLNPMLTKYGRLEDIQMSPSDDLTHMMDKIKTAAEVSADKYAIGYSFFLPEASWASMRIFPTFQADDYGAMANTIVENIVALAKENSTIVVFHEDNEHEFLAYGDEGTNDDRQSLTKLILEVEDAMLRKRDFKDTFNGKEVTAKNGVAFVDGNKVDDMIGLQMEVLH